MKAALKNLERGVRRALLSSLRILSRRKRHLPPGIDFNSCKVLFIRQDRIGDVLISTPLFAALNRRYPGIVLDVLLSRNNHFVLANDRHIRKRWVYTKRLRSAIRTLRDIRSERYDFVVDLMDNPSATSTVILLLAGGKWNVGLKKDNDYACDIVVPLKSRKESHIVERIAQLLSVFGIDPEHERLQIHYTTSPENDRRVEEFLIESGKAASPLIGVNISAGSDTRFWGLANYRKLVHWLVGQYPTSCVVMLSKPSDRERVREITDGLSGVLVAPETTFDSFAAWIRRLSALVSPDTSAVHLAAAFQVPSVILYVQSDRDLRIWEPYNAVCEPLVTQVDDLTTIPVRDVNEAILRLFARLERASPLRRSGTVHEQI